MKINIKYILILSLTLLVAGILFCLGSNKAKAATRTWTGTTSGSWSVASNWGGVAPETGDDLVFPAGASNLSNTNDLTPNTLFNSITISGSGYTLSGNKIILGPGLAGITDSASSGGNTLALDIRLDATRDISIVNSGESLTISGRIDGIGGINKEGAGTLILSGANTFGGTLKINYGVINARNNTALGTIALGTEVVGGASLELQNDITIGLEPLTLRGYGTSNNGSLRNVSGNNTFRGLINVSNAGGSVIFCDTGTLTLSGGITGGSNTILDGSGNIIFDTAPISNTTITKNGAGTVTYNFPNTYTGTTTINSGTLLYGTNNAIMTGVINVTGGTLDIATYSDMVGTVTLGTLDLASGTITGTTGVLSSGTWNVYQGTISAIISGVAGTLTKGSPGTVTLTRANKFTGTTTVNLGILKIQDSLALGYIDGITTVTAGATLQIDGNNLSVPEYITYSGSGHLYTGALYNTGGNNTITGLLSQGSIGMIKSDTGTTLTIDTKGLSIAAQTLVIDGAGNTLFTSTAPIYGTSAAITKNGTGTLTIQSVSNITGATTINRGTLVLSSSGAIPLSAITVNSGGTLTLDNSSISMLNRINDSGTFTLNGGDLNYIGNASTQASETIGNLSIASGHNIITITPGAGGLTMMTFASFARTAGATVLFRGTNLGSNPDANVSTIMFTSTPTLTGASGAANTTTISIIKGAFGDNSLSGTGTDMVTYNVGNTNGLRLLNGAGFTGEYSSSLTTNTNVKLNADTAAATVSVNSLILNGYNITNPGGGVTLTMASASLAGNIIINTAHNIAGSNTTLGITTFELIILANANSTISAVIGTATTGSLTISGSGNITLSTAALYTGTTSVNRVTLTFGATNVLSSGGVTIIGGSLNIGTNSNTVGAVTLQNGTITGSSGVLTVSSGSFREGTVGAIIAGSGTITIIATNAPADAVVIMNRENTYTGNTVITSGILKLGTAGNGTNTPLGTTAGGTTIANAAALDLNGYTLSTAEAITSMNGSGFGPSGNSNMGALMNSSVTAVSFSGAITLGSASRINADYGTLTISSNISGATFGLTIGGFSDSTFSGTIGTTSGTLTKNGIGVLTLSGNNSYTGLTTISLGTIKLGATGGVSNTPLGTTGGATSITTGARLDLNGYTLSTAEPLTLNGVGYGLADYASGALINSSASSVSYSGNITLSSASTVKADNGTITLTGSISGATRPLTIGGSGNGIISGLIGTTSGTISKIGTGTWTLSNAGSTYTGTTTVNLGTLKLGIAGGATNTPLGTTGGGTIVMSGAVLDLAGYTLGTAEALTLNGRGIGNGGSLVNTGGAATFAGAISQGSDSRIANNGSGLLTLTGGVGGAFALYLSGTANIAFSTGVLGMSSGTVTKQGSNTVTITGTQTYTGATRIDSGTFAWGSTTTFAGTNTTVMGGVYDMGGNTDTIGTVTLIDGTIQNGTLTATTSYTLEKGTISAILAGAVAVTKNTNNTVTLTGVNTISSTTTINAGTLVISGSGSAVSTTITVNLGGTLTLDNSSTAVASRLGDALALTLNGGNFNFLGNSAAAASETTGALTLSSGHNVITVTPGAGGSTTMTFASLSRTAGATALFRGTNFGTTPAANVSTLMFTAAPTLTGAGGAANSNTISIIKGAYGDSSLSGTGSDMVTYNVGNTNGLRLLNGSGFSGEYAANLATANANVKLTADTAAAATNTNSLILNGFGITNPGGATTIPIASASLAGNILINSATNIAGSNTTLGITSFELPILATANSTISATIGTATTGSISLSGSGNVTLSAANAYTGTTFINNGTLTYSGSNILSSGGVTIVGGTYDLNGNSDTIGALLINAGIAQSGAGTLTLGGTLTTIANSNRASIVNGNLGLGANRDFNVADGGMDNDLVINAVISGGFNITKLTGTGVMLLTANNTYTGTTSITTGILRLGAAGDSTNTPLGTTAGGTTVSGASSALDLNGFTLGTSEALTLSGALANGALQNTSSTAVSYSGLITLGAASTIISNYGDINISNTGTITGNTFGLTIGGSGNGTLSSIIGTTSGTLTKNGLGMWTVSGSSTFTGLTTISAGTLRLGSAGNSTDTPLGTTGSGTSITSGAILDLNGYTLGTSENLTVNGTGIAGLGAVMNNSGSSISYTGNITLGAASRIANYGNGTLTLTGAISGNFALTLVAVGNITQSSASVWSGSGSLVKEGSGTVILAGQNSMTGAMTVSTGELQLGASGGATNTPLGTNAGGVTVSSGAVLNLSTYALGGASTYETLNLSGTGIGNGGALISSSSSTNNFGATTIAANSLVNNSGSGTITFTGTITAGNNINLGIDGTGPTTFTGVYGATATSATINKWGSGNLTISAASITTGLVRINGGTLIYGVDNALSTPAVTIAGGTLNLNGFNETNIGAVTLIDGSIVNTGGAATLTSTATYTVEKGTISAVLGGTVASGVVKNTAGRVTLSGNNTFTSTSITVNAGYLNLQHNNALGASGTSLTTTVAGAATLELENNITLPATKAFTVNGPGMEYTGAIRNVNGTNTISANVTLGTSNVFITSDANSLTIPSISGNTFNVFFNGAGDINISGAISTTTGTVTKYDAGTLSLLGTNTYTGTTSLLNGVVIANTTSSLGDGSATNTLIFRGGTLRATGTITSPVNRNVNLLTSGTVDTNGNDISFAGTVGSTGSLTKSGTGTLTLTGTTTIGGNLNISAGTFVAPGGNMTIGGNFSNSGTFTHNNGKVIFNDNTKVSTISGSISFKDLEVTTAGKDLLFTAGQTFAVAGTLTLTGTSGAGNDVTLNSTTGSSSWTINTTNLVSSNVTYTTVTWSACTVSSPTIDVTGTGNTNGGNNGACWVFASAGITVAGTVYLNDEITTDGTGYTIKASVNGGSASSGSSDGGGIFSFTTNLAPSAGDFITLWLDTAGGNRGTLVLKYGTSCTGNPNCTGLSIVRDQIRLENFNTGNIANTDLANCDNDTGTGCADTDIGFTANSGVLTVSPNWELKIASGATFAPGNTVTTPKLEVAGTYTGGSETLTLTGSGTSSTCSNSAAVPLCVSGTFTPNSNTTAFTTTSATSINSGTFNNLSFTPAGTVTYTPLAGTFTVGGALTVGNGSNTLTLANNTNSPVFIVTGNTTIAASSIFTTGNGNTTISGDLTTTGTLNGSGSGTINVVGSVGGTGKINLTGGTFEQRVATSGKTFGGGSALDFTATEVTLLSGTGTQEATGIIYDKTTGKYVVAGFDSNAGKVVVWEGTNLDSLTQRDVDTSGSPTSSNIYHDTANGKYLIVGSKSTDAVVWESTNLTNWTARTIATGTGTQQAYDIIYQNGYYIAAGSTDQNGTDGYIWTATALDGTWTGYALATGGSFDNVYSVTYNPYDKLFVAVGEIQSGTSSGAAYVWESTDLSSWTARLVEDASNIQAGYQIRYDKTAGKYYVFGVHDATGGFQFDQVMWDATTPSGTWTRRNMGTDSGFESSHSNPTFDPLTGRYAIGGIWNVSGNDGPIIWETTTPTSTWNARNIDTDSAKQDIQGLVYDTHLARFVAAGYDRASGNDDAVLWYTTPTAWRFNNLIIGNGTGSSYTVTLNSTTPIVVSGNLEVGKSGDTGTTTLDNETNDEGLSVSGNLIINSTGVLQASSTIPLIVGGSWTNSGTFTAGTGTVIMNSITTGKTLSGTLTGNTGKFNNLTFDGLGGAWTMSNSSELAGNLTIAAGTLSLGATTITIAGNSPINAVSSNFSFGTSTVVLTTGTSITVPNFGFYNLELKPGTNSTAYTLPSGTFAISNDLTLGNGTNTGIVITATANDPTIDINGSITISANTTFVASDTNNMTVAKSWTNSGTFTHSSRTVTLDGSTAGQTITANNSNGIFYNLIISGSGSWAVSTNAMQVANTLTVNTGTLQGTQNVTVNSGAVTGTGFITMSGGTFTIDGPSGNFGGDNNWSFNNLSFTDTVPYGTVTATGTGSITISSVLSISPDKTLNLGSKNWILSGTGTPLSRSGTLTAATSTVTYTSSSGVTALSSAAMTSGNAFYNLVINATSGTPTFTAGVAITANSNLTVTAGVLSMGSNALIVGNTANANSGDIKVASGQSLTQNSGTTTTILTATGSTPCIGSNGASCAGTTGTITFGGLTIGNSNDEVAVNINGTNTTITVQDVLTVTSNSLLNAGSSTISLTGNGTVFTRVGTFTASTSTVAFNSTSTTGTTIPALTYYNLTVNRTSNTFTSASGTYTVNNNLTITAGTLELNTNDPTLTISGNLIIGDSLSASNTNNLIVGGNFVNNGTFTHNNGTVVINPTGLTSQVNGSTSTINFYNFTMTPSSEKTIQFKNGGTIGFAGTVTIGGAQGIPVNIASDSAGVRWNINLTGTAVINYAYIKDSGCAGGTNTVILGQNAIDGSNNSACWRFIIRNGGSNIGENASGGGAGQSGGGQGGGSFIAATGTAVLSNNTVASVTINSGGSNYVSSPNVCFVIVNGGSGAVGTVTISNGSVTLVTITNGGSGYISAPTVVFQGGDSPDPAPACSGGQSGGGQGGGGGGGSP